MDQRVQFIADSRDVFDVAELARRYGISRKTAYKWIERYGSGDQPGWSIGHGGRRIVVIAALLDVRRHHPTWGAKKLLKIVATRHPTWTLPARSRSATGSRRSHHGVAAAAGARTPGSAADPDDGPQRDLDRGLGQFKTRDGVYCYPLTIVDGFRLADLSRLLSTAIVTARPLFLRLFQEYGLPGIIRTTMACPSPLPRSGARCPSDSARDPPGTDPAAERAP